MLKGARLRNRNGPKLGVPAQNHLRSRLSMSLGYSDDLFILHEGRKVMIKDNSMKEWKEIQLEDGNAGWLPTSAIEVI